MWWTISIRVLAALAVVVAAAWLLMASYRPRDVSAPAGVVITPLRTITTVEARFLLLLSGVDHVPISHAVDLYRVRYSAQTKRGLLKDLSGLLALPHDSAAKRVVSFQHGTSTTRSAVPSAPDGTGIAASIAFGGNGFAVVVPDYPGLGSSDGRHPYYVAEAIAPSVAALIDAAQNLKGVPRLPAFLAGFSQGGWASLAAVKYIEGHGARVLGSAQVAGAYDLRNISLPEAMKGRSRSSSLYLAYAAWGHAYFYGHPLGSVLNEHHARLAEELFAGASPDEIIERLPSNPRHMFNEAFLRAFDLGGEHWFLETFKENGLIEADVRAPLRLYFGSRDVDVSPRESISLAEGMKGRGKDVEAIPVGPLDHDQSMLAAAPMILKWLFELEEQERETDIKPH